MSIRVMNSVWQNEDVSQHRKLIVLLALADFSDDEGVCFPSVPKIAKKSRMSERNAQRIIHLLCEKKWLEVLSEGGCRDGKNISNRYKILLGTEADPGWGDNLSPGGDKVMTPQGVTKLCHPKRHKDPSKEPPKETKTTGSAPPTDPAPAPEEASSFSFEGNRSETTGERTPEEEAFKKEEVPEHPVPVAAVLDDEQNRGQELSEMAKDFGANPRQKGDLSAYAKRFGFDHTIDLAGYAFRQGSQKGSSHKALFWKAVGEGLATGHPWDVPAPDPGPDPEIEARRQAEKAAQEAKEAEEEAAAAEQQRRALMLWTEASKEQRAELLRDEWLRKWAPKNDETPGR